MGIQTAMHLTKCEAEVIVCDTIERGGIRSKERFPWEQGSQAEVRRGRIAVLLVGMLLSGLVVRGNAEPLVYLEREADSAAALIERLSTNTIRKPSAPAPQIAAMRMVPLARALTQNAQADPSRTVVLPEKNPALYTSRVQFGAYLSAIKAKSASKDIEKRYQAHLNGRELRVAEAIVGGRLYHRVFVRVETYAQATNLCRIIIKNMGDCLAARGVDDRNYLSNRSA